MPALRRVITLGVFPLLGGCAAQHTAAWEVQQPVVAAKAETAPAILETIYPVTPFSMTSGTDPRGQATRRNGSPCWRPTAPR